MHDGWLDICASYLQHTFGDSLQGAKVIDYGCGRGDWALAFLRAGAKHVLAVDAAIDNVRRLHDYCQQHEIDGIDIVHGDLLSQNIASDNLDIVWLYRVLHHISRPSALLQALRHLAPGKTAQFYIYGYDAGSLRQFTVDTARQLYPRPNEDAFRLESVPLTRDARRRARNDLTAPHIDWYNAMEFAELLSGAGLEPVAHAPGLDAFIQGHCNQEFQPHQALCRSVPAEGAILWSEPARSYTDDLAVLSAMAREVNFVLTDQPTRMQAALGLMNTHFTHLGSGISCSTAIFELFLYLLHVLDVHGGLEQAEGLAYDFVELAEAALSDTARAHLAAASHPSKLAQTLCNNTIRL
ncbi:MAG: class I SAM-dependent methyltransferase [Proteobacteria bacterium]|nr:class I SAM-dependent methyltransferase [Pseudomonadota bacterium]